MDQQLVHEARNGDEEAFSFLFKSFARMVQSVAFRIVRDEQIAQDLMQEVFITAFNKLDSLINGEKIESWLYTMTKRKSIDWLRCKHRQPFIQHDRFEEFSNSYSTEDEYLRKELVLSVKEALLRLDRSHRAAVILHDIRGYTAKEIGLMMRESTNTIDSRIRRARQKLRKVLEPVTGTTIMVPVKQIIVRQPAIALPDSFGPHVANHTVLAVALHMKRMAG
ncbi:RNA polymerase sigma factor [Cohnella sp. REN36]|uniref:RNA polymerase sigma factor n=1 Tax=Cohnella sp. REN36 TaxID=2887347 RepID=UPI001D156C5F|nr:RNA polymerase sigma factor [Cohnella sp. REN36]MCC3373742.1 RNA polymerase sigma factor [Cohnella sp. REN36]